MKQCRKEYHKAWYKANKEKRKAYLEANKVRIKAQISSYRKVYNRVNSKSRNADTAKRRAGKLKATPLWADLKAIKVFYKQCPDGYHVDHIIPLQGKYVRGLHILSNLQYLTIEENLKKGRKHESDR